MGHMFVTTTERWFYMWPFKTIKLSFRVALLVILCKVGLKYRETLRDNISMKAVEEYIHVGLFTTVNSLNQG